MDERLAISCVSQHLRQALLLLEGQSLPGPEDGLQARRVVRSTSEAGEVFKEMSTLEQEELWVIALNNANELLGLVKVYRGNASSAIVRPAEVFREAVRLGATAIVIAHNHPSSDLRPTLEDIQTTRVIAGAGSILDIPLLDHLIIGRQGHSSIIKHSLADPGDPRTPPETAPEQRVAWLERIEL